MIALSVKWLRRLNATESYSSKKAKVVRYLNNEKVSYWASTTGLLFSLITVLLITLVVVKLFV